MFRSVSPPLPGLVASLQRDLASRDKQTLNLASEVDRLRQDIRAKDIQLGANATKVHPFTLCVFDIQIEPSSSLSLSLFGLQFTKMTKRHQDELAVYQNEGSTLKKVVLFLSPPASLRNVNVC